jgi:hypothetical protein
MGRLSLLMSVDLIGQHQVLNALHDRKIPVCLISRVQPNSYCQLRYVSNKARRVIPVIIEWIEAFSEGT